MINETAVLIDQVMAIRRDLVERREWSEVAKLDAAVADANVRTAHGYAKAAFRMGLWRYGFWCWFQGVQAAFVGALR